MWQEGWSGRDRRKKELEVFIYCNISCSGISKIVSLQKADLYIDIICITQNKIVKNRKKQYITKKSLNKKIYIDWEKSKTYNKGGGV